MPGIKYTQFQTIVGVLRNPLCPPARKTNRFPDLEKRKGAQ